MILLSIVAIGAAFVHRFTEDAKKDRSPYVIVDGTDISGLSEEKAIEAIMSKYPWSIKVTYEGGEYPVDDVLTPIVTSAVREAQAEEKAILDKLAAVSFEEKVKRMFDDAPQRDHIEKTLGNLENTDFLAGQIAEELGSKLGKEPKDSELLSFQSDGSFEVSEGEKGLEVNQEKLSGDIKHALESGNYTAEIPVTMETVEPQLSKDDFKTLSTYTTKTTSNEARNTNVKLAAQAINGTILAPGETFSYNTVVGKRTPEKGYKEAPAYADGQTVQEYGGGVCQVSSTLYNALIGAGLDATERKGHTFEPSYVTPGQDATVSYMQPDLVFVNTTGHSMGIRASYASRTVTVDLFGVPVLEEGVKQYMSSEKTSTMDPAYDYVEDPTCPFGTEEIITKATSGSVWKTYIVKEKDGQVISRDYLHTTTYRGHQGVIRTNTTNPAAAAPAPAPAPAPEAAVEATPEAQPQNNEGEGKKKKKKENNEAQQEEKKPQEDNGGSSNQEAEQQQAAAQVAEQQGEGQ